MDVARRHLYSVCLIRGQLYLAGCAGAQSTITLVHALYEVYLHISAAKRLVAPVAHMVLKL
jgi:hypothetical protein